MLPPRQSSIARGGGSIGDTGTVEIVTTVDTSGLESALLDYGAATGKAHATVVVEQARLFVRDVAKATPPFDNFSQSVFGESWAEQKRIGEGAVAAEIPRLFGNFESLELFHTPRNLSLGQRFRKAVRSGDAQLATTLLNHAQPKRQVRPDQIVAAPTEALHNPRRNRRGKLGKASRPIYWTLRAAPVRQFIAAKKKLVGKAKAGWAAAALALGVRLPGWIERHASGSISPLPAGGDDPRILIVNTVSYISEANREARFVALALERRENAMLRQLQAIADKGWKPRA